jgi:hypothetical protein
MNLLSTLTINVLYLVLLILGLVYAVFLLIGGHLGGGDFDSGSPDLHMDTGIHIDTGAGAHAGGDTQHGISPISPLTIATFITAFGATGLVAINLFSASEKGSLIWATLGGVIFSVSAYIGFTYLFIKPQGSSDVKVAELAGTMAEVITPIPAGGMGEVAFVAQGGRLTSSARDINDGAIDRGAAVKIVRIVSGVAYVEVIKG